MYVNGIGKGDKVVIVDDVLSTGGTMTALVRTLRDDIGAEIIDILVPVNKNRGGEVVEEETGIAVKTLVNVAIVDGKIDCKLC